MMICLCGPLSGKQKHGRKSPVNIAPLLALFSGILFMVIYLGLYPPAVHAVPVFPGADGYGTETPAGRGGRVYRVINLNASGPGSLDECLREVKPRVCVFEVSGTIQLEESDLVIKNPYITVAGQTAPFPGITVKGGGLRISTHDVLIQHIKIRVGDDADGVSPGNRDGLGIEDGAQNVVIDHCSISWAIDENVALWNKGTGNITISNSIISEALYDSIHPKGPHSMGFLIGQGVKKIAVLRNVLAHNNARNPLVQGDTSSLIVNNLIYNPNWAGIALSDSANAGPFVATIVGNTLIRGPDTNSARTIATIMKNAKAGSSVYADDNYCENKNNDPWSCISIQTGLDIKAQEPSIALSSVTVLPGNVVESLLMSSAGARPGERDVLDQRIIFDIQNRTGSYINSPSDVVGWLADKSSQRKLTLPSNPSGDDDGDGYTNLEEWLHIFTDHVESLNPQAPSNPIDVEIH